MKKTEETEKETVEKETTEEVETSKATEPQPEEEPTEKVQSEPVEDPAEEEPEEEESAEEPVTPPTFIAKTSTIFNKKFILIGLIVIAGLALIAGGILVYKRAMAKKEAAVVPTPQPGAGLPLEETESPEASPVSELKREDLKLQILNGSGISGVAGEAKELLEGLGYQGVETGNADSYDYEEAEISIKEDKKDYLEMLREDLEDEYTLSTESATLDEESEFDAIVIIGSQ